MRVLCIVTALWLIITITPTHQAQGQQPPPGWPIPKIGKLTMPPTYWGYCLEASQRFKVDPYVIAGVMAIESRFDPNARSGRCRGLMQLHLDTARAYGVDPYDPQENVMGGAAVLADLLRKTDGDLSRAIRIYNGTGNRAYLREVLRAIGQARKVRIEENNGQ